MRVECQACHQLVAASFALDGDAVRASCPACEHTMRVPLAPAGSPGEAVCAKCGAPRSSAATACAACGLAAARTSAPDDPSAGDAPAAVRGAWSRATEDWSDRARHDELLRAAAAHSSYAWVAARYRARGSDAITERQLERLRRAAEATLLAGATARRDTAARPYRAATGVLAILVVAIAAGLLYATVIRRPTGLPGPLPVPARPLVPGHPVSPSTIR